MKTGRRLSQKEGLEKDRKYGIAKHSREELWDFTNGAEAAQCFQTHIQTLVWQLVLRLLLWRITPHFIFHHDDPVSEGFPQ